MPECYDAETIYLDIAIKTGKTDIPRRISPIVSDDGLTF